MITLHNSIFPRIYCGKYDSGGFFMSDKKRLIKAIVTGMLCGILTSVTLMCIFALVMTKGGLLPTEVINLLLSGFLAVGAFAGGFVAVKINRGAGLIVGALPARRGSVFHAVLYQNGSGSAWRRGRRYSRHKGKKTVPPVKRCFCRYHRAASCLFFCFFLKNSGKIYNHVL